MPERPGVMVPGATRAAAVAKVQVPAPRVLADRLDHVEAVPVLDGVFSTTPRVRGRQVLSGRHRPPMYLRNQGIVGECPPRRADRHERRGTARVAPGGAGGLSDGPIESPGRVRRFG